MANKFPTHTFIPLPYNPQPVFEYLCQGCGETRENCEEACQTFVEELAEFRVCYWDFYSSHFAKTTIQVQDLKPEKHGYFSYKVYKDNQQEEVEKRRERQLKKRKRNLLDELSREESEPEKKRARTTEPAWRPLPSAILCNPQPLYSPSPEII